MVYMSLVVNLIGQRSRDIGRLSVSRDVIGCEDCKKCRWVSIHLLLVNSLLVYY